MASHQVSAGSVGCGSQTTDCVLFWSLSGLSERAGLTGCGGNKIRHVMYTCIIVIRNYQSSVAIRWSSMDFSIVFLGIFRGTFREIPWVSMDISMENSMDGCTIQQHICCCRCYCCCCYKRENPYTHRSSYKTAIRVTGSSDRGRNDCRGHRQSTQRRKYAR